VQTNIPALRNKKNENGAVVLWSVEAKDGF
jgi:hypothetical protein